MNLDKIGMFNEQDFHLMMNDYEIDLIEQKNYLT